MNYIKKIIIIIIHLSTPTLVKIISAALPRKNSATVFSDFLKTNYLK